MKPKIRCQPKTNDTKKGESEKAGIYWRPIAYLSSFESALKYFVDLKVKESGLKEYRDVVEKQKELYQLIKGLELS